MDSQSEKSDKPEPAPKPADKCAKDTEAWLSAGLLDLWKVIQKAHGGEQSQ
jgi:hypothetical protein